MLRSFTAGKLYAASGFSMPGKQAPLQTENQLSTNMTEVPIYNSKRKEGRKKNTL